MMTKDAFLEIYNKAKKEDWFYETMQELMTDELNYAYEMGQLCGFDYGVEMQRENNHRQGGFWN